MINFDNKKNIVNYTISFSVTTFIIVYLLNVPKKMVNNPIVDEYYIKNFSKNFIFDLFLVGFYFYLADFFKNIFNIRNDIVNIIITTIIISGSFKIYFNKYGSSDSFFYRWFKIAGNRAIIYDCILLSTTLFIYKIIDKKLESS